AQALQGRTPHPFGQGDIAGLVQQAARGEKGVKLGLAEPRRDTAGLAGAILMHDAIATNPAKLPALVAIYRATTLSPDRAAELQAFAQGQTVAPLSEQAVLAYDATNPPVPLSAMPLDAP